MSARVTSIALSLAITAALAAPAAAKVCASDAVQVGTLCVDRYEASVWRIAPANTSLITAVRRGTVDDAAQLIAGGAGRRGESSDDYDPGCPDDAAHCTKFYAVSIPGVVPSSNLTWFQATAACRNAGKRLLTSAEWQVAAFGTPDLGFDNGITDCNTSAIYQAVPTGARSECVSDFGIHDMSGNVMEWVADWTESISDCTHWFADDTVCFGDDGANSHIPAATLRGGFFASDTSSGAFSAINTVPPSYPNAAIGFRCAR